MTEPIESAKEADLERLKFEFEREKWRAELELRRRELELKETEERRRRGFFARIDPISVGIFTAALALMGTIATTWMQGDLKRRSDEFVHQQQRDLERERFEADLIKDYIKGSKPELIENNLQFLVNVGLVVVKASQLKSTLARSSPPALTAGTRPALGDIEREACFLGKDWERSEQACTALLAASGLESTDEVLIRRRRGFVLDELQQFDRAIADYNKAIELDPRYAAAYNNRGYVYRQKGELDRAIADYSKAIELDPNDFRAYNNRGHAYRQKGELDRAITDFNKTIALLPKEVYGWRGRALSRALASDLHGAMADISEALRLAPQDARTLYIRGILLERRGNPSDAAQAFTAARTAVQNDVEWSAIEHDFSRYRPKR
jgi:tetratricopeptide (TPR) repeat protein